MIRALLTKLRAWARRDGESKVISAGICMGLRPGDQLELHCRRYEVMEVMPGDLWYRIRPTLWQSIDDALGALRDAWSKVER